MPERKLALRRHPYTVCQNVGGNDPPTGYSQYSQLRRSTRCYGRLSNGGLIAGMLVLSLTPLVYASGDALTPVSRGIVLTIVAIDPKTDTATLQTQHGGKEFQMTAYASWKEGHKVECDLIPMDRGPQLQNCQALVVTTGGTQAFPVHSRVCRGARLAP